jgi:hypothetical protein
MEKIIAVMAADDPPSARMRNRFRDQASTRKRPGTRGKVAGETLAIRAAAG